MASAHRPAPSEPDDRPLSPGDLVCGRCGAGNSPTRRFCRRCAASLVEAAVVRRPWWHRFLPRRDRHLRRTGERPPVRRLRAGAVLGGVWRGLRWALTILLVLGLLGYAVVPTVRGQVNSAARSAWSGARSVVAPRDVPVRPPTVVSAGERAEHPAAHANDLADTTYWSAPRVEPQPPLVFTFDRPVELRQLIVINGAGVDFRRLHRAERLHLVFSTGRTADLQLLDSPDRQTLKLDSGPGVTEVEVHVLSTYPPADPAADVAITELEFFARR
ncbi:MAG TPA: zinc ribbon domain-containing protein [Pseudonocardiaceae bacterium]